MTPLKSLIFLLSLSLTHAIPLNEAHDLSNLPAYYYPKHTYSTTPAFQSTSTQPSEIAREFIKSKLGLDSLDNVQITSEYVDPVHGQTVVHATQAMNGLSFANSHVSVVVSKDGEVLSWGSSWFDTEKGKKLVKREDDEEEGDDESTGEDTTGASEFTNAEIDALDQEDEANGEGDNFEAADADFSEKELDAMDAEDQELGGSEAEFEAADEEESEEAEFSEAEIDAMDAEDEAAAESDAEVEAADKDEEDDKEAAESVNPLDALDDEEESDTITTKAANTPPTPKISAAEAVAAFVSKSTGKKFSASQLTSKGSSSAPSIGGVPGALADVEPKLKYYQTAAKTAELVWSFAVEMSDAWPSVIVDATSGKVLGANDWVSNSVIPLHNTHSHLLYKRASARLSCHARRSRLHRRASSAPRFTCKPKVRRARAMFERSVRDIVDDHTGGFQGHSHLHRREIPKTTWLVVPVGQVALDGGLKTVVSPEDPKFSPNGWNDFNNGRGAVSTTAGNNVIAVSNPQNRNNVINNQRANGNANFVFDFKADDKTQEPPEYADASITNMFFVANSAHDLFYAYGFTEVTGNFQFDNFGKGGKGNDPVVASAQDGSGTNNANFATPPDGQPGRMRMFVFTLTNPNRDGALENPIVFHELAHGLSNRLVGGDANANCLTTVESVGLGEGWSDFFGVVPVIKSTDTRNLNIGVGTYVTNSARGVRSAQYSTSTTVNKNTYSTVRTSGALQSQDVHFIGEVFMEMLYEVYWNVVEKAGASDNLKDDAKSGKGNTVLMQLVVDSLKLVPCNPTMIDARDAIVLADEKFNGGKFKCEIQKGFAKRGMGVGVKRGDETFTDDFTVDAACK